eukprot:1309955-Alexandrium_andersonii.AAC.1
MPGAAAANGTAVAVAGELSAPWQVRCGNARLTSTAAICCGSNPGLLSPCAAEQSRPAEGSHNNPG